MSDDRPLGITPLDTPCRLTWLARDRRGYGRMTPPKSRRKVFHHRFAYAEHHGLHIDAIDGMVVMHLCDNPPCINPDHLRLGTHADNVADMIAKGRVRAPRGSTHFRAKLDENAVREIRRAYSAGGETYSSLARQYGVAIQTVGHVLTRRTWAWLK